MGCWAGFAGLADAARFRDEGFRAGKRPVCPKHRFVLWATVPLQARGMDASGAVPEVG